MAELRAVASRGRSWRTWSTICIVASLLVGIVAVGLSWGHSRGSTSSELARPAAHVLSDPPPAQSVRINATDAPSFAPNKLAVANGTTVNFHLTNTGTFNHTFTLLKTPNLVIAHNATPAAVNQVLKTNGTWVNISLPAKGSASFNLTFSVVFGSGVILNSYEFLSVVPYQFQAGMFGFVNVTGGSSGPGQVLFINGTGNFQWVPANLGVSTARFPTAIKIHVGDIGSLPHTWTLDPVANDTTINPGNWPAVLKANPPPPGANVSLSGSGASAWANFTLSKGGVYTFFCTVPGHYQNGMNGSLFVNVPLPASGPALSGALVNPLLLVGAAGLFGLGVILAVIAQYRGRFPPRSGY